MRKHQPGFNPFSGDSIEKISIEQLRSIWNDDNHTYKDEELHQIRDWLYSMHEIIQEVIEGDKNNGTLPDLTKKKQ